MSYNGIGLSTARGSGTNGHVQKNRSSGSLLGNNERRKQAQEEKLRQYKKATQRSKFTKDEDIKSHEAKRNIEVLCARFRDNLEDSDEHTDEDIDEKVREYRLQLITEQKNKAEKAKRDETYKAKVYESVSMKGLKPEKDSSSELEAQAFMQTFNVDGKNEIDY